jgi:hypothetical protein
MPRRPPKEWFYYVVGELEQNPDIKNAKAVAAWLWYKFMKPESKKAILKAEGKLDPDTIKVRRGMVKLPRVTKFADFKGQGLMRLLWREDLSLFPELALYLRTNKALIESLKFAGLKEESRGKWVLRTERFSIFVYV